MKDHEPTIRLMRESDFADVAQLSGQLGYRSEVSEIAYRFVLLKDEPNHALLVAASASGQVLGYVHICCQLTIVNHPSAEIAALVVDDAQRGKGIGRLLMQEAETWAKEKGLLKTWLRSSSHREGAHMFYADIGYEKTKTSHLFSKRL